MIKQIVIASGNKGKIKEFDNLLSNWSVKISSQSEFDVPEADETGLSFVENAIIKARNACEHTGLPSIADDSGLSVEALNGEPGIYSARYSQDLVGNAVCDATNNQKLLSKLEGVPDVERKARFICAVVFMRHAKDPVPVIAVGEWQGRILHAPQGANGFGYDPLFYVEQQACASAELLPEIKNKISHRGQATKLLVEQLQLKGLLGA